MAHTHQSLVCIVRCAGRDVVAVRQRVLALRVRMGITCTRQMQYV